RCGIGGRGESRAPLAPVTLGPGFDRIRERIDVMLAWRARGRATSGGAGRRALAPESLVTKHDNALQIRVYGNDIEVSVPIHVAQRQRISESIRTDRRLRRKAAATLVQQGPDRIPAQA